jgi:hypothetical protein
VDAVLRGLGDAEQTVAVELLAAVLRRFYELPARPGGRWIVRPLAQVADQEVPLDVLDIASWYATEDPDPSRDMWRRGPGEDVEYYGGDPFSAGINSVRGAGAEALSALIWPRASRLEYLSGAVRRLVRDPIVSVRACAAVTLRSAYRHDSDLAVDLFKELCETDEAVLRTRPIEDFLSVATRSHLPELRPILERMLRSSVPEVQNRGRPSDRTRNTERRSRW